MLQQGRFYTQPLLRKSQGRAYQILRSLNGSNYNGGPHPVPNQADFSKLSINISGISGRFPQSESIEEFKQNLLNGTDMLTKQTRFTTGKRLPPKFGFLNNLETFDADFFGISDKMAQVMDPSLRKLLEVVFETIVDAGINPESLRKTTTGVFVGSDGGDALSYWNVKHGKSIYDGYTMLGNPIFMLANQVSHIFDLKGPSTTVSTGCASSIYALESAVNAILAGKCERAIVAATTLHLNTHLSKDLNTLGALSPTGQCKPFDKSANGFVRGEAVVSILIEKDIIAKRSYARIIGIRGGSDGFKKEGIFYPSGTNHQELYKQVYNEAGIDPASVDYIETHGTGTRRGDSEELKGIFEAFCNTPNRTKPLLIGSVKSSIGHSEAAAGLASIAKILISTQTGVIPATINFHEPSQSLKLFQDSIQLVTKNTPFSGGLVGFSSFGIGGTSGHVILDTKNVCKKSESTPTAILMSKNEKQRSQPGENLPILIPFSGREEETLRESLISACNLAQNPDAAALIQQVHKRIIPGHNFRGYGILHHSTNETNSSCNNNSLECNLAQPIIINIRNEESININPPIWLVFPGMGSQWQGMGKELMKIDAFQESYRKSQITLKNVGVDLDFLLLPKNTSIFENIRDAFTAIAAMQIALFDTMRSIGISPDGYLGHSFGEILCAYSDNCISAEEALLIVDARGRAMLQGTQQDSPGAMAAIGLSWSETKLRCLATGSGSNNVVPACHNGPQNVTVSGTESAVNDLVKQLQNEGIFAKKVNSCGIAAHSPFILPGSTLFFRYLQDIFKGRIDDERKRSNRWISTSIPESEWNSNLAQNASPEYFVNNFVNPVLFYEALSHIPKNAIVIEVAPQGLFQGILKTVLPDTCSILTPMQYKSHDRVNHFLTSVGDIFNAGVDVDISKLYPPVNFPISAQTPSISPLIKWKHDKSWNVPIIENTEKYTESVLNIDFEDNTFSFLEGHKLEDCLVYPATGYLVFAWKSLADSLGCDFEELPVEFTNVTIERAVVLNRENTTQLRCSFHHGQGTFEIHENGSTVAYGGISIKEEMSGSKSLVVNQREWKEPEPSKAMENNIMDLKCEDIYKELKLSGYNFSGNFKSIKRMNLEGSWAEVHWNGNWITFLDSVLQVSVLSKLKCRATYVPVLITSLKLNPVEIQNYLQLQKHDSLPVNNKIHLSQTEAPGVEVRSVICQALPSSASLANHQVGLLAMSKYEFIPYIQIQETNNVKSTIQSQPIINPNHNHNHNHTHTRDSNNTLYSTLATMVDIYLENNCQKNQITIYDTFTKSPNTATKLLISQIFAAQPLHQVNIISTLSHKSTIDPDLAKQKDLVPSNIVEKSIATLDESRIPEHSNADLVLLDDAMLLNPISNYLKSNAWIIIQHDTRKESNTLSKLALISDLKLISKAVVEDKELMLFRKVQSFKLNEIQTLSIDKEDYSWLPHLKTLLANSNSNACSRIYVCSQNNPVSGIIGLIKCLMREPSGGKRLRCLHDPNGELTLDFENPNSLLSEIISKDLVMNIVQNGGCHGSFRHVHLNKEILTQPTKLVNHARVMSTKLGDFSGLKWVESPLKYWRENSVLVDGKDKMIINVNYAALNFHDIMAASSSSSSCRLPFSNTEEENIPMENNLGCEFSGMDKEGNRLMGVSLRNSIATTVLVASNNINNNKNDLVWKIPEDWSLEEAATVPIAYGTAYYSLIVRGNLKPGQSVLIHSGTGAVGQAAINLALSMNCQVFTTVGTEEEQKHILELFPTSTLNQANIVCSTNCDFEQSILEITKGRGVDFVLNSLNSEDSNNVQASVRCLASYGTFLDIGIGKFGTNKYASLGMRNNFLQNINFCIIDIEDAFSHHHRDISRVYELVQEGIVSGVVKPLKRTVFRKNEIENAFKFMAKENHIGKVLIQVKKEDEHENATNKNPAAIKAIPKTYFDQDKTYLIVGGLGGLGLELANWMVQRGAKHLILTSRSGLSNGYQQLCLKRWRNSGVRVETPKIDLSVYDTARIFLKDCIKEGKILGGFFNSGLVLKDSLLENQTEEMFKEVAKPKIKITENMDKLTREFCNDHFDYFVTFSSLSAGLGNAGQSNYGFANSAMEQICLQRRKDGFHAASIQWGVIGDVGYVAENMKKHGDHHHVFDGGMFPQKVSSCLEVLDSFLQQSKTSTGSCCFSSMIVADKDKTGEFKLAKKFTLLETVARLCSIKTPLQDLDPLTKLSDLGLHSLSLTELQQLLHSEHNLQLSSTKIRTMTWGNLIEIQKEGRQHLTENQKEHDEVVKKGNEKCEATSECILVNLQRKIGAENEYPLFILPGGGGLTFPFIPLAEKLDCSVYAFQTGEKYTRKGVDIPVMEDFVEAYLMELRRVQPHGPYNIAGYSGGTNIAYVMAQQLESKYSEKVNLIMLDAVCGFELHKKANSKDFLMFVLDVFSEIFSKEEKKSLLDQLSPLDTKQCRNELHEWFSSKLKNKTGAEKKRMQIMENSFYTFVTISSMLAKFKLASKFKGQVTMIEAKNSFLQDLKNGNEDNEYDFRKFCEQPIEPNAVPGDHVSFLHLVNVGETAKVINKILLRR